MGGIGLASAEEISSWLDLGLHKGIQWKESFLGYDLEALSPSIMVLCVYTKIWRENAGTRSFQNCVDQGIDCMRIDIS